MPSREIAEANATSSQYSTRTIHGRTDKIAHTSLPASIPICAIFSAPVLYHTPQALNSRTRGEGLGVLGGATRRYPRGSPGLRGFSPPSPSSPVLPNLTSSPPPPSPLRQDPPHTPFPHLSTHFSPPHPATPTLSKHTHAPTPTSRKHILHVLDCSLYYVGRVS